MQGYGSGIAAYRQTQVSTADPRSLVILCYEHVIKQLAGARRAYESKNFEAKGQALANVHDTVELLLQSLDFEKGGQVAVNLQSLYTYALRRITHGDLKKDPAVFDEVAGIFKDLLSSWKELPLNGKSAGAETTDRRADSARAMGL